MLDVLRIFGRINCWNSFVEDYLDRLVINVGSGVETSANELVDAISNYRPATADPYANPVSFEDLLNG